MTDVKQGSGRRRRRADGNGPGADGLGGRVTLQDVADRAGVSLTTASRVVNEGSRRVSATMASRVNNAVAELGYMANLQARAVATGQSTTVGVVVHDIADPYFSSIAAGLIDVAYTNGLLVCMSSTAAREAGEARVRLAHARPAGQGGDPDRQPVRR